MNIAVIDVETNYNDEVMSIGIVIANAATYQKIDSKYYILAPEYQVGGMYSLMMKLPSQKPVITQRNKAINEIKTLLRTYSVTNLFAYNAKFDYHRLYELSDFVWHDIIGVAAYKQYNHKIPSDTPCCATGKMKRGYSVENMMKILSDDDWYVEKHNALCDALDELKIMRLLGVSINMYEVAVINR